MTSLRDACHELQRLRDRLQWQLDTERYSDRAKPVLLARMAALDEVLPVAMHEADLRAAEAARLRAEYGVHHVPLAAP